MEDIRPKGDSQMWKQSWERTSWWKWTRSSPQASDSIAFVICSFVFMHQPKQKLVLDPEEILPRAAYSVTICIHIKFFFTYKSGAKYNWFGEWHVKCQTHKNATAHTSSSWQRHSFQNISLYLLIMPKKARNPRCTHLWLLCFVDQRATSKWKGLLKEIRISP